jgi:hypothetical protein
MQIYAVITSTKLVMKLKLVSLESGSSPLSNDASSVSIRCIVWKIFAFKTTPLKNDTFQPDTSSSLKKAIFRSHKFWMRAWKIWRCEICEFDDAIPGNFARVVQKLGISQTALIVRIFVSFDWKIFKGQYVTYFRYWLCATDRAILIS